MRTFRLLVPLLAAAGLSACSGMQANSAPGSYTVDTAKVAAVERAARTSGVNVYWVHYPLVRAAVEKQVQ